MTISSEIIEDSISESGVRLTTMRLKYPRFVHSEFMTHRVFSRNASSSRAIPVKRMIEDVRENPARPVFWGANRSGMQASAECDSPILFKGSEFTREEFWEFCVNTVCDLSEAWADAGYHKQLANRWSEPAQNITVVVTATQYANFFGLRCHADAQPEIKALADQMYDAYARHTPTLRLEGEWHLPFVTEHERANLDTKTCIEISVARCARTSYNNFDGTVADYEKDVALFAKLVDMKPIHASPTEHQAVPDEPHKSHGNFHGWKQYRKMLDGECIETFTKEN